MAPDESRAEAQAQPGVEPWMSGTLGGLHPVIAALLYSFQQARQDIEKWTCDLTTDELSRSVAGLATVSFQIRHIAGSIDRLLTYARGEQLTAAQLSALRDESSTGMSRDALLQLLAATLERAAVTVCELDPGQLNDRREIGRKRIPVPLGTLLVHIAEHTQRHVGEVIVTAKALRHAR